MFDEHSHRQLREIIETQKNIMSAISDFQTQVEANFAAIKTGIANLDSQIQALQNSSGTLSASDQAALTQISTDSAALAAAAAAVVPTPAPTPTPAPAGQVSRAAAPGSPGDHNSISNPVRQGF
jgi:prophage DNA circulation protein